MKAVKKNLMLVLIGFFVLSFTSVSFSQGEFFEKSELRSIKGPKWTPGEIIVKFKRGVSEDVIRGINQRRGTSVLSISKRGQFRRLRVPRNKTVEEMVAIYSQNPNVEYAEPNFIASALMAPNDPLYSYQWHLDNYNYGGIHMESAWSIQTGNPNVVVAVIDTGVAYEDYGKKFKQAPDLANTSFVAGYDFVNNDSHPNDDEGHGTHVAGTIAQSTNNDLGVAGVAFNVSIMPIKVLNKNGSGTYADIADGIYFAADNGALVINMSLGGSSPSSTLENALIYAYDKGVTIVCAAGNEYEKGNPPSYPAAYDNYCIAVGATRYDETRAYYSNTGDYLDIVAPGGDIYEDQNNDGYGDGILQQTFGKNPKDFDYWFYQGTSMASPHVAGVAALVIANGLTGPDNVRAVLESTAEDKGLTGWDEEYGWGIVDAYAALTYSSGPIHDVAVIALDVPFEAYRGDIVSVLVTVENQGTEKEKTTVSLTDTTDGATIGSEEVSLNAGDSTIVPFDWDTTGASIGDHTLKVEVGPVSGETDIIDNSMETTTTIKEKLSGPAMHILDIAIQLQKKGSSYQAKAYVTIVDESGSRVAKVAVTGDWTLNDTVLNRASNATNGRGIARLESEKTKAESGNTFAITITDVVKNGYLYDPDSNLETSGSITVP